MRRLWERTAIVVAALCAVSSIVRADEIDELVAKGQELAKQSEWTQAIDAFKQADAKRPRALHACMIGLAYTRRELWPDAELFFARCHARASASDRIVMFGGQLDDGSRVQDVWILEGEGTSFAKIDTTNPPPRRAGGQFVFDPRIGALIMIGGYDNLSSDDAYVLNDKALTQLPGLPSSGDSEPGGVAGGSPLVAYDSDRTRILPSRSGAALVHLPDYNQTFVTCGLDPNLDPLADTWVLDDTQPQLSFIPANLTGSPPTKRAGFGAVYSVRAVATRRFFGRLTVRRAAAERLRGPQRVGLDVRLERIGRIAALTGRECIERLVRVDQVNEGWRCWLHRVVQRADVALRELALVGERHLSLASGLDVGGQILDPQCCGDLPPHRIAPDAGLAGRRDRGDRFTSRWQRELRRFRDRLAQRGASSDDAVPQPGLAGEMILVRRVHRVVIGERKERCSPLRIGRDQLVERRDRRRRRREAFVQRRQLGDASRTGIR